MKKGILVASFGTSFEDTREKNIIALEKAIAAAFPDYKIYSAYTSGMVIKALFKKGIEVDSPSKALEKMAKEGIDEIIVVPTHLLFGDEYEKLCSMVNDKKELFSKIEFSKPLLSSTKALFHVLQILHNNIPCENNEALVLMGHGTNHYTNPVYAALNYMAIDKGYNHIFIGTVEAYPDIDNIVKSLKKLGYQKAVLSPLMLVAGDHATNDMASMENDSWKSILINEGIQVRCILKGLGEYEEIQQIYCKNIEERD